jgi:hypothetical protein
MAWSLEGNQIGGWRYWALVAALVAVSIAIHGYHYGIEDEAVYLPAIKAHFHPELYPHDRIFFEPQVKPMLLDDLVAASARVLHAPVDCTVFGYYVLTLAAFFAALWTVVRQMFPEWKEQLGGVLLVATLLTLPIAGTSVFIVDQHLHPRTLATALILWAAARLMRHPTEPSCSRSDYAWVVGLMVGAAAIHIQMAFYGALFLLALVLPKRAAWLWLTLALGVLAIAMAWMVLPEYGPHWQEASRTRAQHYLLRWTWYEWLGAVAPPFVLWGMAHLARRRQLTLAAEVALRTAAFAAVGFLAGCVITIPPQMEKLTPFQPLRMLHLTYIVMVLLAGALLASFVLKRRLWRWALLFLPIAAGMSYAQFNSFPDSHHVEWPQRATGNDWVDAFHWIKTNTPVDAYFVLDPHYLSSAGEDFHGLRGLAERSQMADWDKDAGVALLFPELAERWWREVHALDGWENFTATDFHRLHEEFGVGWTVLPYGSRGGQWGKYAGEYPLPIPASDCPWHNRSVMVCKLK